MIFFNTATKKTKIINKKVKYTLLENYLKIKYFA